MIIAGDIVKTLVSKGFKYIDGTTYYPYRSVGIVDRLLHYRNTKSSVCIKFSNGKCVWYCISEVEKIQNTIILK